MSTTAVVVKQIGVMFVIMLIGAVLYKSGTVSKDGRKQLSGIVLKLVCPAVIFKAYQIDFSRERLSGLLTALVLSAVTHLLFVLLSHLFIKHGKTDYEIERLSVIYSNCSFMGIPLVSELFGDEGVLYITAYVTVFNIFVWTHGDITLKGKTDIKTMFSALLSPALLSVAAGIFCFLTGIRISGFIETTVSHIAAMNTPLAMLATGAVIADTNILKALKNTRILYISILRLIIFPAAAFIICRFFTSGEILTVLTVAAACPSAATGTLLAVAYGKNSVYSSEILAVNTLFSPLTLAAVVFATQAF